MRVLDESGFAMQLVPLAGSSWIPPYHHFAIAELDRAGVVLKIRYWTHDVVIHGRNLEKVVEAVLGTKKMILTAIDPKFESDYAPGDVFISYIGVSERKEDEESEGGEDPRAE